MTQSQLVRTLCRATGESRQTISRMGFQLVKPRVRLPKRRTKYRRSA